MLDIYDGIFDRRWVDELAHSFWQENWKCGNIASFTTWPYGLIGNHSFLGNKFFKKKSSNIIEYNSNKKLTNTLIKAFDAIINKTKKNLELKEIGANLQFNGMDGSYHSDGGPDDIIYVLMLSNETIDEVMGGSFIHKPTDTEVKFRHGRLIEFGGLDFHKGNAFNKKGIARFSVKWVGSIIK
jgi:hypothetical protein